MALKNLICSSSKYIMSKSSAILNALNYIKFQVIGFGLFSPSDLLNLYQIPNPIQESKSLQPKHQHPKVVLALFDNVLKCKFYIFLSPKILVHDSSHLRKDKE